jgi:DNA polymerase-3 subunit delta
MASTSENILTDLKNRIFYPIYLFYGEEPYFIDQLSDHIEEHMLTAEEKEFNQTVVYGKDLKAQEIISMARRYPMMANYQVIIVKEAQDLDDIEEFTSYAENPVKTTVLVLCYKYGKIDKRKKLSKWAEKNGVLFESAKVYDSKIPEWIQSYVGRLGYTITEKSCYLLLEFLGNDLSKIVNEVGKLAINLAPGSKITEEYIERNIGISKDFNVIELQKALGSKDVYKANQIILYFAANPRENPLVKVIPILYTFFSKVLLYHTLEDKSRNSAAAALSVNPFFLNDYQLAAKNHPVSKVYNVISLLREYDLRSKGVDNGSATDGELMKEMVYRILH